MKGVLQRVAGAKVSWEGGEAAIGPGLLLLLGLEEGDDERALAALLGRLSGLAVFDRDGAIRATPPPGTPLLIIPNFTLAARLHSGAVPDFSAAMAPAGARHLFAAALALAIEAGFAPTLGRFGAEMLIKADLDGPVTYLLER